MERQAVTRLPRPGAIVSVEINVHHAAWRTFIRIVAGATTARKPNIPMLTNHALCPLACLLRLRSAA
jgi:hypothetical protein